MQKIFRYLPPVPAILLYCLLLGCKNDPITVYIDENGNKKAQGRMINGQREGEWSYWDKNGNLELIGHWKNGKQDSTWTIFYITSDVDRQDIWSNGVLLKNKHYYKSGTLQCEALYKDGQKHGDWNYYDFEGNLCRTVTYKNDKVATSQDPRDKHRIETILSLPEPLDGALEHIMYNDLAASYHQSDMDSLADHYYQLSIQKNGQYKNSLVNYAKFLSKKGAHDKAIGYLNQALALDSTDYDIFNGRGHAYLNLGQTNLALEDLLKAFSLNDQVIEVYGNLIRAYEKLGENDQVEKYCLQYLEKFGDYEGAYLKLLHIASTKNQQEKVLELIKKLDETRNKHCSATDLELLVY